MTCGIYRPVVLSTYSVCIDDIFTKASVDDDLTCSLEVDVSLRGQLTEIDKYRVVLKDSENTVVRADDILTEGQSKTSRTVVSWNFNRDEVRLWWPVGYGEQALYTVELTILSKVVIFACFTRAAFSLIFTGRTVSFSIRKLFVSGFET